MRYRYLGHCMAVLWFLTICLPFRAAAQNQIRGTVISATTDAPLPNVQVYLTNLKRGTVTDDTGHYVLRDLQPGTYRLQFSLLGFEKIARRVTLQAGETRTVRVALQPTTLRSPEVVVVANDPRRAVDVPLPTASLDQAEQLETGALSLWDAMDRLPGMARSTNGPGIERPYIRGLSGGRILLMMQDVPYAYQTWDPELGLTMTGNGTEQVDVIQGPATLQYGPGAMGGVIDLVQEHPAPVGQTQGSYTLQATSNTKGFYNELALKQTRSGWFWGTRAGFDTHADYHAGGEEEGEVESEAAAEEEEAKIPNSRYNHLQLKAFTGLSRRWGSTRLTYQYLQHKNGIIEAEEEEEEMGGEEEGREIEPPYHAVADHILTSDTQIRLGRGWLHGVLGLQRNDQQEFEPAPDEPEGKETGIDLALTTAHYRLNYEVPLTDHWQLKSGLQGYVQHNESGGREPFVPNADENQVGLFSLLTWSSDRLSVEGGLRYDLQTLKAEPAEGEEEEEERPRAEEPPGAEEELERSFNLISGSIGLTYQLQPSWNVKLNVGTGNRAPSLAALSANGLLREVHRFLIGDADLNAEYNTEVDLTSSWHGPGLTLSVGAFYNRMYNYTYQVPTGETIIEGEPPNLDTFPIYRYRQDDANFWGGHAEVDLHPPALGGLRLYSQFDLTLAQVRATDIWLPMIPAHHLRNGVELTGTGVAPFRQLQARVELDSHFEQERVPGWATPTESYTLTHISLNARLPWAGRSVLLGLHARNLFNVEYISPLSLLKREGIPNMGRTITLSAHVPFGW